LNFDTQPQPASTVARAERDAKGTRTPKKYLAGYKWRVGKLYEERPDLLLTMSSPTAMSVLSLANPTTAIGAPNCSALFDASRSIIPGLKPYVTRMPVFSPLRFDAR
jgi:hypothetical protein